MNEIDSQTALAASEDSAPPETIETPSAEMTESAPVETEEVESTETPETTEEKGSEPKVVKELKSTRKRARDAEREAAYWRGVAEGRVQPQTVDQPKPVEEPAEEKPPKMEDYGDDYEAFEAAKVQYYVNQGIKKARAELTQQTQNETAAARAKSVRENFEAMIEEQKESNPDFPEIVQEMGQRITPMLGRLIMESSKEESAALILHLHNDPKLEKEITRLSQTNPLEAAMRIGAIKFELKSKPKPEPPPKVSKAPEPITTVKPTAPAPSVDVDDLPIDQYIAAKNKNQYGDRWQR